MVKVMNFGSGFEEDLTRVAAHIETQRQNRTTEMSGDRELVRNSIEAVFSQKPQETPPPNPIPNPSAQTTSTPVATTSVSSDPVAQKEVEQLVKLAFEKRIETAVREAEKKSPHVLDAFHDALVDQFLPELKKRGLL